MPVYRRSEITPEVLLETCAPFAPARNVPAPLAKAESLATTFHARLREIGVGCGPILSGGEGNLPKPFRDPCACSGLLRRAPTSRAGPRGEGCGPSPFRLQPCNATAQMKACSGGNHGRI